MRPADEMSGLLKDSAVLQQSANGAGKTPPFGKPTVIAKHR